MVQLRSDLVIFTNQIPLLRKRDMMVSSRTYEDIVIKQIDDEHHTHEVVTKTGLEFVIIKDSKSATFVLSESQVQTLLDYIKGFVNNANI